VLIGGGYPTSLEIVATMIRSCFCAAIKRELVYCYNLFVLISSSIAAVITPNSPQERIIENKEPVEPLLAPYPTQM
jgi:hypothetical protein